MSQLPALEPTSYSLELRDLLRAREPELWSFFASAARADELAEEARRELLRTTNRIDAAAHPELAEHLRRIGSAGQTQVKDLASEAAAAQHVGRLIAEKIGKCYTAVGA